MPEAAKPAKAKKAKAKKAKASKPEPKAGPAYSIAKCNWCGMQWKHYGEETPPHFCGKLCASHEVVPLLDESAEAPSG